MSKTHSTHTSTETEATVAQFQILDSQGGTQTVDMAIVNASHVWEDLAHVSSKSEAVFLK